MPFNWKKDIRKQPAEVLLLLDENHYDYLASKQLDKNFAFILKAYPHVAWYIANKYPKLQFWINKLNSLVIHEDIPSDINQIVADFMESHEDWIIYVTTPEDYHRQSFIDWDETELTKITDFSSKTVVDIGSGTGKQAFAVAHIAKTVYCVEPVWNLRKYLKKRAEDNRINNVYVVDGVIKHIPFEDGFADITMGGHVIGENIPAEIAEMERVTKYGGMVVLCPGNIDSDNEVHKQLLSLGFSWSRFLEPGEDFGSGYKRNYWKTK